MSTDSAPDPARVNSSLKTTLILAGIAGAFILYVIVLSTARLAGAEPLPGWVHGSVLGGVLLAAMAVDRAAGRAEWRSELAEAKAAAAETEARYQQLVSQVVEQRRADAQALLQGQRTIIATIAHVHERADQPAVEERTEPVQLDRPRAAREWKRGNRVRARVVSKPAALPRSTYWEVYSDVMNDLGGVREGSDDDHQNEG